MVSSSIRAKRIVWCTAQRETMINHFEQRSMIARYVALHDITQQRFCYVTAILASLSERMFHYVSC
jgi:hypothetical protein